METHCISMQVSWCPCCFQYGPFYIKNQFTKDFVYIYISMWYSPLSYNLSMHMQGFVEYNSFSFIFSCCIAQYSISNTTHRCVRKDRGIMPRAVLINIPWHIFDLLWTYRMIVSSDLSWHIVKASSINPSLIKVRKNATVKGFLRIWQYKTWFRYFYCPGIQKKRVCIILLSNKNNHAPRSQKEFHWERFHLINGK